MVAVVDGQNVRQLKHATHALVVHLQGTMLLFLRLEPVTCFVTYQITGLVSK